MNFTVVNSTDGTMHVHRTGCRDLAKEIRRSNGEFTLDVNSREEAVQQIWSDFIDEWDGDLAIGWENTQFYPCVRLAP